MKSTKKIIFAICAFFVLLSFDIHAQYVRIANIEIVGDKKTKLKTILRELTIQQGDRILVDDLPKKLQKCEQNLMNSSLFSRANVNVKKWNTNKNEVDILVTLKESWYIFPFGNVAIADRNFNVWWKDKKGDLRRLYYTGGVSWNNTTGHADRLRVYGLLGYGQKINIYYNLPNLGKNNNLGIFFYTNYRQNKEIWYETQNDSLQFFQNDNENSQRNVEIDAGFTYRHKINTTHRLKLRFDFNQISTAAFLLNPKYLGEGLKERKYWSTEYTYIQDRRNFRPYPTKGAMLTAVVEKQGLLPTDDINALYLTTTYVKYLSFTERWSAEFNLKGRYEFSGKEQPYLNSRAFGFGKDYLRGYEYYIVDGVRYGYLKSSIRYKFFNKKIDLGDYLPNSIRFIPLRMYATVNNDIGKVYNPFSEPSNKLANEWLYGKGIGIDFHAYYGSVFQVQYSFNKYNKGSFFFHYKTAFE